MDSNIRHIWAVGRNYADHAKELGNSIPTGDEPMIFLKAGGTAAPATRPFVLPTWSSDIHHELELAVQFDANLELTRFTLALDLTARDAQNRLKKLGHPWTLAKSFRDSCPIGDFLPCTDLTQLADLELRLTVNGELRQQGRTSQMIFPLPVLRDYILSRFPVAPGDLILTGTPAGVGPIRPGDSLIGEIVGHMQVAWTATQSE